jgi:maltokinase
MTDVTAAVAAGDLAFLDESVFNTWVVAQRWFASKTREVSHIEIVDAAPLRADPPLLVLCLIEARFPVGTHETYQVPLGLRPSADGWAGTTIYEADGWIVYDALQDPATGRELLHAMRANRELGGFSFHWVGGAGLGGTVDVRPVGVEQSNTSIIFGDELIMKAIRRIEPGVNPELELLRFLSARGFPHIASLAGWYEVEGRHISATLGILQEFLAGARDGWELALDELVSDPESSASCTARSAATTPIRTSRRSSRRARRCRSSTRTSTSRSSRCSSTCPTPTRWRRSAVAARTCASGWPRSRTRRSAGG